jgi:serine/threonine-protein kinase RsbW
MAGSSNGLRVNVDAVLLAGSVDAGSLEAMRGRVRALGPHCGLDEWRSAKFVLVVHELIVNAIRHGGGRAEAVVWTDPAGLRCLVTDRGGGIARRHLEHCQDGPDGGVPRYGLRLVRQVCAEVRLHPASHGTHIEIGYPTGPAIR